MKTVTVALMTKEKVLLLQRNPDAYPGIDYVDPFPRYWELIGGHVEEGEEPLAAAIREVWEETGIQIAGCDCHMLELFWFKGGLACNHLYRVEVEEELPVVLLSIDESRGYQAEHLAYAWTPIERARSMKLAFKHSDLLALVCERVSSL